MLIRRWLRPRAGCWHVLHCVCSLALPTRCPAALQTYFPAFQPSYHTCPPVPLPPFARLEQWLAHCASAWSGCCRYVCPLAPAPCLRPATAVALDRLCNALRDGEHLTLHSNNLGWCAWCSLLRYPAQNGGGLTAHAGVLTPPPPPKKKKVFESILGGGGWTHARAPRGPHAGSSPATPKDTIRIPFLKGYESVNFRLRRARTD